MSKLFRLKKWLTISETSRRLSQVFDEPVSDVDVLQLALEGHLQLSVWFPSPAYARHAEVSPIAARLKEIIQSYDLGPRLPREAAPCRPSWPSSMTNDDVDTIRSVLVESMNRVNNLFEGRRDFNIVESTLGKGNRLITSDHIQELRELYDLPMFCGERLEVEAELADQLGGGYIGAICADGCLVRDINTGELLQIQFRVTDNDGSSYTPAAGLPEDAYFVVRTDALLSFEQSINDQQIPVEKPMATSERNSLLTIIAALCDYSAIELQGRGAATQIARLTEDLGVSVSDDTVRRTLAKIPDALKSRLK